VAGRGRSGARLVRHGGAGAAGAGAVRGCADGRGWARVRRAQRVRGGSGCSV
jgi:hypothetical protein